MRFAEIFSPCELLSARVSLGKIIAKKNSRSFFDFGCQLCSGDEESAHGGFSRVSFDLKLKMSPRERFLKF